MEAESPSGIEPGDIPKHEFLERFAASSHLPFIEYDEKLKIPPEILNRVDLDRLKESLWLPLSVTDGVARVITSRPGDPAVRAEVERTLGVSAVEFIFTLPSDLRAIIDNHQDINPGFPPVAGRTPLARLRTWLARQRVHLSHYRTLLAKGRTGLAFIRTGMSFISISLLLYRVFGAGYSVLFEIGLLAMGLIMVVDGYLWYRPARKARLPAWWHCTPTEATFGTTFLKLMEQGEVVHCARSEPIPGAQELRRRWHRLSPVMKRRFLAIDRTDLAEERTSLAGFRTKMARARTGLAFTRTGIAFVGLGIALLRHFGLGVWSIFDAALTLFGLTMIGEGFHWYLPGRRAGKESVEAIDRSEDRHSIWDFMFRLYQRESEPGDLPSIPAIGEQHCPGIWGTTGLALERTFIAERRNVKARLRTAMARCRTGLSLIRTGTSTFSVGIALLAFFGTASVPWTLFDLALMLTGMVLIADGSYWYFVAERTRKAFPYCYSDMEIVFPDYGAVCSSWTKVVFGHDDI